MTMRAPLSRLLAAVVVCVLAIGAADAATKKKKPRLKPAPLPQLTRDYDGTPIIMQGYTRRRTVVRDEQPKPGPKPDIERPVRRGSSTLVMPPVPAPGPSGPSALPQVPPIGTVAPIRRDSFGDRVTNCIHSFPLAGGIGNNPANQQAYIRQCAN